MVRRRVPTCFAGRATATSLSSRGDVARARGSRGLFEYLIGPRDDLLVLDFCAACGARNCAARELVTLSENRRARIKPPTTSEVGLQQEGVATVWRRHFCYELMTTALTHPRGLARFWN